MFDSLSDRLNRSFKTLSGRGRLTEDNIKATLREVRMALLEADVALPVVKQFIADIRERAVGSEVMTSLTPGQALVGIRRRRRMAHLQRQLPAQAVRVPGVQA